MWPNNKPWLIYPEEVTPLAALWITMTNCSWAVMVSIQWNWWNFRCKHGRESINSVLKWLSDCWWLNVSDQILASVVVLPLILLLENIVPYFYWKVLNPSLCWEWTLYAQRQSDACAVMSLQARRGQMLSRQETSGLIDTNLCVCASPEGQNETSTSVWFPFPLKNLLYTVRPMQRYCEQ